MRIEAKGYNLEITVDELWLLAFSVKNSLENSIKNHWVNNQDVWKKNEKEKLMLLETMFTALGRLDVYNGIFKEAEIIFEKFNKK